MLDVKHPQYATYAKLFSQPGGFYQYVAYLNPGDAPALLALCGAAQEKGRRRRRPSSPPSRRSCESLRMTLPAASR